MSELRTFFGDSSSISLGDLNKGGSLVPNPTTYGSSTAGGGDVLASGNGGSIPLNQYDYGGVCPSLDTEANTLVNTSATGEQSMDHYYGAYEVVNPSINSLALTSYSNQQQWAGNTPTAYYGFYAGNYAALGGSNPDYCRLFYCQSVSSTSTSYAVVINTFKVSHPGIYTLYAATFGNSTSGCYFSASGTGVTLKNHALSTVTGNQTLPVTAYASNARYYELHVSDESQTITTNVASSGSGSEGFSCAIQLRTNCNYLQHVNTTDTTNKTVHLSQTT